VHIKAERPFKNVCFDIAGPLLKYQGKGIYLVLFICFSKFVCLIPLKSLSSEDIAVLFEKWISIFSPPKILHSDH